MKALLPRPLILALVLVTQAQAAPHEVDEHTTKAIVAHHWKTFVANDLEGTMIDYTEDSVLITPKRVYRGLAEIRENFVAAFANFPTGSSNRTLDQTVINRDVGYIIWEGKGPTSSLAFGTDTFIVRHGKIVSQTFGGVPGPHQPQ